MGQTARGLVLAFSAALACAIVLFLPPIHQDAAYHRFADVRVMAGIPNAWNVLSNAPFALVGALGIVALERRSRPAVLDDLRERWPFLILYGGVFLTAFGSGYYHWAPDSERLFWDRLPMTLGFMSLFGIVLRERVSERLGAALLPVLITLGVVSVLYWRLGDGDGHGDLRLYVLVQFYPLIALPLILVLFPPRYRGTRELVWCVVFYGVAKALEVLDARIFSATGELVSGHALKHLAAALATWFLVRMALVREPCAAQPTIVQN